MVLLHLPSLMLKDESAQAEVLWNSKYFYDIWRNFENFLSESVENSMKDVEKTVFGADYIIIATHVRSSEIHHISIC